MDRQDFLKTLAEACQKTDWQVHAYLMDGKLGENHAGELRCESAQAKAERIIGEELQRRNSGQSDLVERRKGDPEKLAIALRLRRETSLNLKSVAARLHLGSPRRAGERLRQWIQTQALSEGQRQAELGI